MQALHDADGITLYHGDSRDLPPLPGSVDLVLTDPPYGVGYTGWQGSRPALRADAHGQGVRVARQALFAAMPHLALDAHLLTFCSAEAWPDFRDTVASLMPVKNALIWHKALGGIGDLRLAYAKDYEVILFAAQGRRSIAGRRDGAVLRSFAPVPAARRRHPTEKPVELLAYLIERHCPPGGLVLDLFAGSASTLVAARQTGRRAVGIEIDPHHAEVAAARLGAPS